MNSVHSVSPKWNVKRNRKFPEFPIISEKCKTSRGWPKFSKWTFGKRLFHLIQDRKFRNFCPHGSRPDIIRSDTNVGKAIMDTFDKSWQETEKLLFTTWNLTQLYAEKDSFPLACALVNLGDLGWSHVGIEVPYPALFPLPISHPNLIKTRNPAPTHKWNFSFQPLFSAQIPNITAKKSLLGTLDTES